MNGVSEISQDIKNHLKRLEMIINNSSPLQDEIVPDEDPMQVNLAKQKTIGTDGIKKVIIQLENTLKTFAKMSLQEGRELDAFKSLVQLVKHYERYGEETKARELKNYTLLLIDKMESRLKLEGEFQKIWVPLETKAGNAYDEMMEARSWAKNLVRNLSEERKTDEILYGDLSR